MKIYRIQGTNTLFPNRENAERYIHSIGSPLEVIESELMSYDAAPDVAIAEAYAAECAKAPEAPPP